MLKSIKIFFLTAVIFLTSFPILANAEAESLYTRLGGYAAISAVVDDLVDRLAQNKQLGRFYQHRGRDGINREKQLTKDYISEKTGGPLYYRGRNMKVAHAGMRMSKRDWKIFMGLLNESLQKFNVPSQEKNEVNNLIDSLKIIIVE